MPDIRYKPGIVRKPIAVCGKNILENKSSRKAANFKHYVIDANGPKKYYTVLFSVTPSNKHSIFTSKFELGPLHLN